MDLEAVVTELINRRQHQVLVHSIIYYDFNANIIPDHKYDEWSKELAELMLNYPWIAEKSKLSEMYRDFDGSTGFQLCARANEYQRGVADRLLRNWQINKHIEGGALNGASTTQSNAN